MSATHMCMAFSIILLPRSLLGWVFQNTDYQTIWTTTHASYQWCSDSPRFMHDGYNIVHA